MAIFSTLRSRKITNNKVQNKEQMIGFKLYEEWFALPILAIHKVIPLTKVCGDPNDTGISIATYEGQKLLVVDVAKQIFDSASDTIQKKTKSLEENILGLEQQRYLLILKTEDETAEFVGLPIDSQPTMYRIETSAFKSLPESYLKKGNIHCITSKIIELPDTPPLFVLDPQKLMSSLSSK